MNLKSYLDRNSIDTLTMAGRLGVTKEAVRLWICGERRPRLEHMLRIAEATGGEVMPNDFAFRDPQPEPREAAE